MPTVRREVVSRLPTRAAHLVLPRFRAVNSLRPPRFVSLVGCQLAPPTSLRSLSGLPTRSAHLVLPRFQVANSHRPPDLGLIQAANSLRPPVSARFVPLRGGRPEPGNGWEECGECGLFRVRGPEREASPGSGGWNPGSDPGLIGRHGDRSLTDCSASEVSRPLPFLPDPETIYGE